MRNPVPQGKLEAASYLVGERLIRVVVGFFIHAWMARSLTPEAFGFIAYVVKGVAVYFAFGLFGNDELIIKQLISSDIENQKDLLKTISILRLMMGVAGWLFMLIITGLASSFGSEVWIWMLVLGISIPIQALTVYELPFFAKMAMKPVFYARNTSYFVGVCGKILALINSWTKTSFILVYALEEAAWKLFVYLLAARNGWSGGKFRKAKAVSLWNASLLSFIAAFILLFDQRLPYLFLDHFGDPTMLGQYSVVIALIDIALLVPISLSTAMFPSIAEGKHKGISEYRYHRQHLANWLIWMALAFAFGVLVTAPWIIHLLYAGKYTEVTPVLRGMAFTAIISFFNVGRFKWFALDNALRDWIALLLTGIFVQSIALYSLIPRYGLYGVVLSALLGQLLPNILLSFRSSVRESLFILFRTFRFKALVLERESSHEFRH